MARTKKRIVLSSKDCKALKNFTAKGIHSVRLYKRACVILASDASNGSVPKKDSDIAHEIGVSRQTVQNVKTDYLNAESIETFLQRKKRETPPITPKVTGDVEAHIVALACSPAPEGYSRWSLRLLADKCVDLEYIDNISHMTVGRVLKKHNLSLI